MLLTTETHWPGPANDFMERQGSGGSLHLPEQPGPQVPACTDLMVFPRTGLSKVWPFVPLGAKDLIKQRVWLSPPAGAGMRLVTVHYHFLLGIVC